MANDRVSKALGDVISALTELKEAWDEQMASYTPQVIITDGASEDLNDVSQVNLNSEQSEDLNNIPQVDQSSAQSEDLNNISQVDPDSIRSEDLNNIQPEESISENVHIAAESVAATVIEGVSKQMAPETEQPALEPAPKVKAEHAPSSISMEQVTSSTPAASAASSISVTAGVQGASATSIPSFAQPASSSSVAQGQPQNTGGRVCPLCGTPATENSKFCLMCGANIPVQPEAQNQPTKMQAPAASFCHKCGAEILPGDRFCIGCGTPV